MEVNLLFVVGSNILIIQAMKTLERLGEMDSLDLRSPLWLIGAEIAIYSKDCDSGDCAVSSQVASFIPNNLTQL